MFIPRFLVFPLYICLLAHTGHGQCFDELPTCSSLAAAGCVGTSIQAAVDLLTFCRESCRRFYADHLTLPEALEVLGGVEDSIENVFGARSGNNVIYL